MNAENCSSTSASTPQKRHWVWLLLISLVLFALGLYVTFRPLQSYVDLSIIFGWVFIITGVAKIFISIAHHRLIKGWGWYLAYGIVSLVLGIYLVYNIALTMETLPLIFAFWLLLQGSFVMSNSIYMRPAKGWAWLMAGGVLIVAVAFILMFNPLISFLTIIIWTGVGLYIAAVSYFMMAIGIKKPCR